ncbi:MAG: hypothetical protein N2318_04800, partial [Meiothermus sp.]|nr:hypothetical protein [Meiothermus sp.]
MKNSDMRLETSDLRQDAERTEIMQEYLKKARGGRVVQTPFLEADALDELRRLAKQEGIRLESFGGLPLAARQVAVLFPEHIPAVADPTRCLLYTSDAA